MLRALISTERPAQASHSLAQALERAARIVAQVLAGANLGSALSAQPKAPGRLGAAAQDLAYGTLRGYGRVDALAARLLRKPVQSRELYALLLVSLAELQASPSAPHTVVDQAVEAAALLGQPNARGLVNAVLRSSLRRAQELDAALSATETGRYGYPQWWIERVRAHYPEQWEDLLEQGNRHPPMTLRVNRRRTDAPSYMARLTKAGIAARQLGEYALRLDRPCPVESLPGFGEGEVSVQDAGAQRAAPLLDVQRGMRVLDACSAPGGKAGHLLELSDCELTALDISAERARRIEDNLLRLGFAAEVRVGDAREANGLLEGRMFERILLDAPCSASGVVRRHPDIKWNRRPSDIGRFARAQAAMLDALWRLLTGNGKLLYATCSVFPEENGGVVRAFLERHPDARRLTLSGIGDGQILPSADSDGFYYALLSKSA